MKVKVKFFSVHREILGASEIAIDVDKGARIEDLLEILTKRYPNLKRVSTFVSLNHHFAKASDELKDGDEVALFPPVGGG